MARLGFTVRDYSTRARLAGPPDGDLLVIVPRRPATLPPLEEVRFSSVRLRDKRLYFEPSRNGSGDVVVADVPAGTYDAGFYARGYVPFHAQVAAPHDAPIEILLHRDASYRFDAEDTLILGEVVNASGAPHTGFDVTFFDLTENIPNHRVPLNAKGQFVIFVPEKRTTGSVNLHVHHAAGIVPVLVVGVVLKRPNIAHQQPNSPVITVP